MSEGVWPEILIGDCREVLRGLPEASVHCVISSPPYWGLRAYLPDGHEDKGNEIGLEPTPDCGQDRSGSMLVLRDDLTEDEVRYVLSELAKGRDTHG